MLKSRQLVIEIWLEHINKNHVGILPFFFDHWVRFTQNMALRSELITITDRDIWITDKIFREIKETQRKMLV
jgi:hypothetical protein